MFVPKKGSTVKVYSFDYEYCRYRVGLPLSGSWQFKNTIYMLFKERPNYSPQTVQ